MSLLRRQYQHGDDVLDQLASNIDQCLESTAGRYEPQALLTQRVPTDPYAAWLAQREAESEFDDRPRVRWITAPRSPAAGF